MTEEYSEQKISEMLDGLIDTWEEVQAVQRKLIEYEKPLPDPPSPIVNVRILADFVREKMRRERALLDTTQLKNELEGKLEEIASGIKPILPENIPILYTYQGENIDRKRKRYGIVLEQGSVRLWRLAS